MELQLSDMAEWGIDPKVITTPDDDNGDDWPYAGPQNPDEAQEYSDKVIEVFDTFADLIHQNNKDALPNQEPQKVAGKALGFDGTGGPWSSHQVHQWPWMPSPLTTCHERKSRGSGSS